MIGYNTKQLKGIQMKFEDFKKMFDECFGKVTPKEFIQRMGNLGYQFENIETNQKEPSFGDWMKKMLPVYGLETNQTPEEVSKEQFERLRNEYFNKSKEVDSLSTEIKRLNIWKAEQIAVTQPIFDYMQNHKDIALGESMTEKIVEFAKERDYLKLKLSGKTFSCPACDSMAERNRELEEGLRECKSAFKEEAKYAIRNNSNRDVVEYWETKMCKIEKLLSNQNNKK